jgi:anti-anti-sigma regulatory factor
VNTTLDQSQPGVTVASLDGELDASNYRDLIALGRRLYASGTRRLVLDLAGLSYMASSGIVALHSLALVFSGHEPPDPDAGWQAIHDLSADTGTGQRSESLALVAPGPAIQRTLDRTGLSELLPVFPTREAALAG